MVLSGQQHGGNLAFVMAMLLLSSCAGGRESLRQRNGEAEIELESRALPTKIQLAVSNGQPDTEDLYPTVVIVESDAAPGFGGGPGAAGSCSGVLIEKNLVLTAAHCMCLQPREAARKAAKDKVLDKSDCATRALVKRELISTVKSKTGSIQSASFSYPGFPGSAFLPDEFRMEIDSRGDIHSIRADFAVIRLNDEVSVRINHEFATRESAVDDRVFVVGFGSTTVNGKAASWNRHFGDNMVTGVLLVEYKDNPSSDEEHQEIYFHREREANSEEGDSGGPCFREDASGHRWLVGIINGKRPSIGARTVCLSTFRSQEVIDRLISKARARTN